MERNGNILRHESALVQWKDNNNNNKSRRCATLGVNQIDETEQRDTRQRERKGETLTLLVNTETDHWSISSIHASIVHASLKV